MSPNLHIPEPSPVIAPPFTLETATLKVRAGRGRLELPRSGARRPGLHRGLGLAEPERVRRRPRPDPAHSSPANGNASSNTGS